jgi:preprotein translocase subunit SecG
MKVRGSMNLVIDLLLAVYILVSLLLVLVVLMQRPRSEGLGTAFASGMVEQYIGPATSVLVRFTTWMSGAFFVLSILLAVLYSHRASTHSSIGARLRSVPAVKASATPKATIPKAAALPIVPASPATVPAAPAAMPAALPTAAAVVPALPTLPAASAAPATVPVAVPPAPPVVAPVEPTVSVAPTPAAAAAPAASPKTP